MGAQRVLQAAGVAIAVAFAATSADAAPARKVYERVAIIDLGPSPNSAASAAIRKQIAVAAANAGLQLLEPGAEDALAGLGASEDDTARLASSIAEAQRAFGALDCKAMTPAAMTAGGIAAARQAAGLPAPELARAWSLLLLCADRTGDVPAALEAAARLRAIGGSPDVPPDVLAKYPEVDAIGGAELVALEITTDVPGAQIWIDLKLAGTSPLQVTLRAGHHVIAAASGTKRGWASGSAVKTQPQLAIPLKEYGGGKWNEVAQRVAGWKGAMPAPAELGWAMAKVRARVAFIRRGDTVEVWGRVGLAEAPHRLGGEDAVAAIGEIERLVALAIDRVQTWNDRSPDPDKPLLLDDLKSRGAKGKREVPTKWWVYATLAGALAAGATIIYLQDAGGDRQRVELRYP